MSTQKEKIWIQVIRRRGEPVLMNSYLLSAYQDQYHQEILLLPRGIHDAKYLDGFVIFEANDIGMFEASFAERLTPEYLTFFLSKCGDESDRLLSTAHEIRSKAPYDSMTNTELLLLFAAYSSDAIRMMPFLAGIVILEIALQKEIEKKLTNHCQQHNIEADPRAYLNTLIFPKEKSIPSQALIELYELGAEVYSTPPYRKFFDLETAEALQQMREQFPEFTDKLDIYLKKYDFMDMEYYAGRPVTLEDLFGRIKVVIDDAKNRLTRIEQDNKRAEKEFEQALDKLKLTPELRSLIDSARSLHTLRQLRADSLFKAGRDVFEFMITIGERLNVGDYDAVIALTWQEISESLLKGQLVVDSETIAARQAGYGFLLVDGELSYITGDALAKELAALSVEKKEVKEFEGNIAFHGKYRGRVAIVTTPEEIDKVQPGDVLVSAMTDPYYVPAMVRAGAIVTDEGGILSHAAIISRELGVPCIVGTGCATSVLKDGVTVEVDASGERGRVRIVQE